ncbi:MAG: F0F1 ATP synthase subunit epsilon [Xanthomonadaceae bacterium]|nr:F0F1 ATP synthase subunit epsilon [Xanthomonadaceae bacterium]MDE2054649.1 F0F1 ATP synthase subunit epsilon [Xanthomonadaceae bacterium]MDE2224178.1 F0F1 ATP synthase subunit epsilon [Xanthomonadaceae bacterium]MDE2497386.1 F0F1 ATP synthase subunit epsilon [Xanthomonadaceae bacterium]
MATIRCDIVSAEANIFHGEAALVIASGEAGELGIAPRHEPLLTRLKPGQVEVIGEDGKRQSYYVSGGILEVQPNVVTVLADTALRADEIDEAAVKRAKEEAERMLENRGDAKTVKQAQEQLTQALAQLSALERLRKNLQH